MKRFLSSTFAAVIAWCLVSTVSSIVVPSLTPEEISSIETTRKLSGSPGGALQFAKPYAVSIDPSTHGSWDPSTNTWTLSVKSNGAKSLNFGFTKFTLPTGAKLTIKNTSKTFKTPTVKASDKDNQSSNQYWTPILETDEVIITLEYVDKSPMLNPPTGDITLGFVNVGFRSVGGKKDKSGSCNVDVACPLSQGWEAEIRSVAGISVGGSLFCTGAMINNAREDSTP